MAVGLKTIEIIQKERLLKNAETMGKYFIKRLKEIQNKHSKKIIDVRGLGLMIGCELSKHKQMKFIIKEAFKNGLLLLGCGEKTVRIAPPLIIKKEEADLGLNIFEKVLKRVKK